MKDDVKDSAPTTTNATNNDKKLRTINPAAEEVLNQYTFPIGFKQRNLLYNCFRVVGSYWISYHRIFRHIRRVDPCGT